MMNQEHKNSDKKSKWKFISKNGFSILIGAILLVLVVSPDAKTWVLRQLVVTGIFNPHIDKKNPDTASLSAIDFNFKDEKGRIKSTAALRGKVVFINFWASWCPPCRAEFPSIEALYSRFKDNPDIFFLMINEDDNLSAAKEFLEKGEYPFPLYKAGSNLPGMIYSGTLPTTIVLDKKGKIRFRHEGFANYGSEKFIKQMKELTKTKRSY